MIRVLALTLALFGLASGAAMPVRAADTAAGAAQWQDVGQTGFGTNRLVLASACTEACPWG